MSNKKLYASATILPRNLSRMFWALVLGVMALGVSACTDPNDEILTWLTGGALVETAPQSGDFGVDVTPIEGDPTTILNTTVTVTVNAGVTDPLIDPISGSFVQVMDVTNGNLVLLQGVTNVSGNLTGSFTLIDASLRKFAVSVTYNGVVYYYDVQVTFVNVYQGNIDVTVILTPTAPPGACGNDQDDDGDGLADYPDDPGCEDPTDDSERRAGQPCDDGLDNDADGYIDFDPVTYANPGDENTDPAGLGDPVCTSPFDFFPGENSQCQDGLHNDGDNKMDYDGGRSIHGTAQTVADPQCIGMPERDKEKRSRCGLGFELVLLLPVLIRLHRRRRRLRV